MSLIYSVIGFVVLLGVLVFVHEWGHYAVARLFNIQVLRFSIGFGPVLWRHQRGETEWVLSAIPLGGYVRMLDEREGPVPEALVDRAFNRQPPWKRIAVVAAGPLINLLFAWLLFALVYGVGYETVRPSLTPPGNATGWWIVERVDDRVVHSWGDLQAALLAQRLSGERAVALAGTLWPDGREYSHVLSLRDLDVDGDVLAWLRSRGLSPRPLPVEPVVGRVLPGSPAARAGLQPGDRIERMDDVPVTDWASLVQAVQARAGQRVVLSVLREGVVLDVPVVIGVKADGRGFLGVGVDLDRGLPLAFRAQVRYGLAASLAQGWHKGVELLSMTLNMIYSMLTGQAGLQNLSGPVSIAQFSGQALAQGWISFVMLMGLISLSLGVLNLLPIPMLDGGHILFDLMEWLRGQPLSESTQLLAQKLGLVVLLSLMVLALSNDMVRLMNG